MSAAVFQADPLLSRRAPTGGPDFEYEALLAPPRSGFRSQQAWAVLPALASPPASAPAPASTPAPASMPAPALPAAPETTGQPLERAALGTQESVQAALGAPGALLADPAAEGSGDDRPPTSRHIEGLLAERYREGFEEGLAQGAQLALAQLPAAQVDEPPDEGLSSLLQSVGRAVLDLRGAESAESRFEPLKRLALHLAVELVRTELHVCPQAIDELVRRCVQALGQQEEPVVVELHPLDLERLRSLLEPSEGQAAPMPMATALGGVQWRADEGLTRGSVRARSEQSMVEDLIENRLSGLVRDLRVQAQRWQEDQTRLQQQVDAPAEPEHDD